MVTFWVKSTQRNHNEHSPWCHYCCQHAFPILPPFPVLITRYSILHFRYKYGSCHPTQQYPNIQINCCVSESSVIQGMIIISMWAFLAHRVDYAVAVFSSIIVCEQRHDSPRAFRRWWPCYMVTIMEAWANPSVQQSQEGQHYQLENDDRKNFNVTSSAISSDKWQICNKRKDVQLCNHKPSTQLLSIPARCGGYKMCLFMRTILHELWCDVLFYM